MIYKLPSSVEINGKEYEVRTETEDILHIIRALNSAEWDGQEKSEILLRVFYFDFEDIPPGDYLEAIEKCFWFINGGEPEKSSGNNIKLIDWDLDWPRIVSAINNIIKADFRTFEHFHWFTFLSYFYEIRDGLLRDIVGIRYKKARRRPLDKAEREFYRNNRDIIDVKPEYTQAELEFLEKWSGKKSGG